MITEHAYIQIDPANRAEFEQAVTQALPIFKRAKGCRAMKITQVMETPGRYILQIEWETLENHMVDFRNSADFENWRNLVGGFFTQPPLVEHIASPCVEIANS